METQGRRCKQLLDNLKVKKKKGTVIERGSTKMQSVENSLWKRLQTCHKTTEYMNQQEVSENYRY